MRPGSAGVLFQSRAARRLWQDVFNNAGGGFTTTHPQRFAGVAMAGGTIGRAFDQGRRGNIAPAFCLGNDRSVAPPVAARTGSGAGTAVPGAAATGEPAISTAVANRGAPAGGLSWPRLSVGGLSASFSTSIPGLRDANGHGTFAELSRLDFADAVLRVGDNTTIPSRFGSGLR